jgi:murein DD-endopeptidase MepM/ murein hydrolase activator NlpD
MGLRPQGRSPLLKRRGPNAEVERESCRPHGLAREEEPSLLPKKILAISLCCAGLYAAVIGGSALAQDPTPTATGTPESAQTPAATVFSPTPTSTSTASPSPTSTATQTATPTVSSTPFGKPATPTPFPSPVETVVAAGPTPGVTPGVTPGATPTATATPAGARHPRHRRNSHGGSGSITDQGCLKGKQQDLDEQIAADTASPSTTASECDLLNSKAPADPLAGDTPRAVEHPDGVPTPANPNYSVATPGAAPIGVPNFFIDKFRIPPFLLPVYQAAGTEYGVRWEVLAAINEIETDYGRNLNVSSAGALGWMQFMPATWKRYGVDANRDGLKDPFNPVDAIFAAARYLRAAGADTDVRKAIYAYNHADWYVDSVLMRARLIGGLPADFVGSLTGLTQGRFPVHAKATYAGQVEKRDAGRKTKLGHNAAYIVQSDQHRRGIKIFARRGAPVIAVNDGRIVRMGETARLGRFIQLQDTYGNSYTYGRLGSVAKTYPSPKPRKTTKAKIARELKLPSPDAKPTAPASDTARSARATPRAMRRGRRTKPGAVRTTPAANVLPAAAPAKQRLFAHPSRPNAMASGGKAQLGDATFSPSDSAPIGLDARDFVTKPLKKGSRVVAGTILGRIGKVSLTEAPNVLFELRPAGRGAPRVDPKPILDGWKLLESTAIYRAKGKNPFFGDDAERPSLGQILLMGKEALSRHVLANPRIDIYSCGARDIRSGAIDRRVLATLEFLAASGLKPTVTALECGHSYLTASGNVSEHSSGNAVDIAMINGIPIVGHQGKGSITDLTIQRLLTLQGTMKPDQIISLMTFQGADNTLALPDHYDHIHVGYKPLYGTNSKASKQVNAVLKPKQWIKLIDRLKEIDNPEVSLQPSKYSVKAVRPASEAHTGE